MPNADLATLESEPGWRPFPHAILPPAVLYTRKHPDNPHYRDPRMLNLALRIGDLLVGEGKNGSFAPRLDSHRDAYMWLEAYRLLELTVFTLHLLQFQTSTLSVYPRTRDSIHQPIPTTAMFCRDVRSRKLVELPSVVVVEMCLDDSMFRPAGACQAL